MRKKMANILTYFSQIQGQLLDYNEEGSISSSHKHANHSVKIPHIKVSLSSISKIYIFNQKALLSYHSTSNSKKQTKLYNTKSGDKSKQRVGLQIQSSSTCCRKWNLNSTKSHTTSQQVKVDNRSCIIIWAYIPPYWISNTSPSCENQRSMRLDI